MIVTITAWEPADICSTVVRFTGTDEETDEEVTIGVDHRVARDLAADLEDLGEVRAHVEDWQILRRA